MVCGFDAIRPNEALVVIRRKFLELTLSFSTNPRLSLTKYLLIGSRDAKFSFDDATPRSIFENYVIAKEDKVASTCTEVKNIAVVVFCKLSLSSFFHYCSLGFLPKYQNYSRRSRQG